MQSFIEKCYPDKEVANHAISFFNDNTVFHFGQVLKCRQKQTSLDRGLMRQRPNEPEASFSGAKRQKRERTSEEQLPDIFTEGYTPSKQ